MKSNPFAVARTSLEGWVIPVSVMCLILGILGALAWVTDQSRPARRSLLGDDQRSRVFSGSIDLQEDYQKLNAEVTKLREENTKLQNAMADRGNSTKALNDSLQEVKAFAGLTDMEGPGIVVTLKDIPVTRTDAPSEDQVIHDTDVLKVVNELFNADAEAVDVNGNRIVATTNIRCVGTTILVDSVKVATPISIRALGDPDTLMGAVNIPMGVLDQIREIDPSMVTVEKVKKMRLPAYSGATSRKHAKVVEAAK